MQYSGNTKIVPYLSVDLLVELSMGMEANVCILLYFTAEGALSHFILHTFCSVFHQHAFF